MKVFNKTKNSLIASEAQLADTYATRMKGLIGRDAIHSGEALIITRCQSIHMFFMKFAIDVIFIDKENIVVGLSKDIQPWQMSRFYTKAKIGIETPSGIINQTNTSLGDIIEIQD